MTLILGIDPGLQHTGWGIVRKSGSNLHFLACGTITPPVSLPLPERLRFLHDALMGVAQQYHPQVAAVEETFVSVNAATTLKLGQARGAIMLTLSLAGLPVYEYAATRVKKTVTGVGRAEKAQIQAMIGMLLPASKVVDKSADAADALAVAVCHAHYQRVETRNCIESASSI